MKLHWFEMQLAIITLRNGGRRWGDHDNTSPQQNAKKHTESAYVLARLKWKTRFHAVAHRRDQPGLLPFRMQFNDCTTNTANGFRPSRNLSATQTRHSGFKRPSNNWKPYWIFFQKSNCREALGEIDVLTSETSSLRSGSLQNSLQFSAARSPPLLARA